MLTAAAYRRRFDGPSGSQVSRFVNEIPEDLLQFEEVNIGPSWSAPGRATLPSRGSGRGGAAGASSPRGSWSAGTRSAKGSRGLERRHEVVSGRSYQPDDVSELTFDSDDVPGGPSHGVSMPTRNAASRSAVGKRVHHEKFGHGTVLDAEGEGPDMKLEVRFTSAVKKVLARFVTGAGDGD